MALFKFLKRKKQPIILEIDDVKIWLDKYVANQELGTKLGIINRDIHSKIVKLKELLQALEDAELENSKVIPDRAKSVMVGNRKAYVQKIQLFLETLDFPEKYDEVKAFLEQVSEDIDELAKATQKNFFILKEFMEDKIRPIASKINDLDKAIVSARETLDNTSLDKVKAIKTLVEEFRDTEQEIYSLRKNLEESEKTKLHHYDRRNKIEDKIKTQKKGKGYAELKNLKEKEIENLSVLDQTKKEIHSIFSSIEPALKKRYNATKNAVLGTYMKNSVDALIDDSKMKILTELSKIKNEISKLELKPDKEKRILKNLEKITESKLKSIVKKLNRLLEEKETISSRIKNHSIRLNIKEQEGWLKSIDEDILQTSDVVQNYENQLERLNLNLIKQKIEKRLKELDENVELKK